MKKIVVTGLLYLCSTMAQAENWYAGAAYSQLDTELNAGGFALETSPSAINLTVGRTFNKNFALEGLLGFGLNDDGVESANFDFELKSVVGASAVGILPLSDSLSLYGKLGLANVQYDDSDGDAADAKGAIYGAGIKVNFSENIGMNVEYAQYPEGEYKDFDIDVETSTLNLGVVVKF